MLSFKARPDIAVHGFLSVVRAPETKPIAGWKPSEGM